MVYNLCVAMALSLAHKVPTIGVLHEAGTHMPLEEAKWKHLEQQQSCRIFGGTVLGAPSKGPHSPSPSPLLSLFQFPFCFLSSLAFEETFHLRKINVLSGK